MKKLDAYKLISINAGLMLLISILCFIVLVSKSSYADDSYVSTATIRVAESCSITSTLDTPHIALLPAGIYSGNYNSDGHDYRNGIGKTTIKAFCNDPAGFSIYAIGYTNDTFGNNTLIGPDNNTIVTGTGTSGETSNWAMKIGTVAGTYAPTLENGYDSFKAVPSTYDKVASFNSVTDLTNGSSITTTYAAYIASTQAPGTYNGKVKYTLVHPVDEAPLQPETTDPGKICYYANARIYEGTMGCQNVASSVTLLASNFSRTGYGFAGWSDKFDYATNPEAKFYGPQETMTIPDISIYNGEGKGLSLYAVWVKSAGNLQDSTKVSEVCNRLTTAPTNGTANLSSVSAFTDSRDNNTYAVAKLADGNCWMIENLRLDNTASLTLANTNNPLNDGTNVTLKHSYSDTDTHNTLSTSQDPAATAWCQSNSASCDDQSMLFTGNTTNRASYETGATMTNSANIYSYGNYYNWYSATAGRGTYSFSTNNNSVAGDLCPAGWHLPIGGRKANVDVSDFWKLSRATIGADPANFANDNFYYRGTPEGTDASNKMRAYPNNFVYSGGVYSGSVDNRGSLSSYWSSTAGSSNNAYSLILDSSNVNPGTGNDLKYGGRTVRCVAPGV